MTSEMPNYTPFKIFVTCQSSRNLQLLPTLNEQKNCSLRHRNLLNTRPRVLMTSVSYHFTRHTESWSFFQLLPKSSDNHSSFCDRKGTNLLKDELL